MDNHQQVVIEYDNAAEDYLQQLRKKISHQVKNPFNLPMINFQFEQLNGWKNATVQLDTSTKLYGLRVDFLHDDVLKVVHNVVRNNKDLDQDIHTFNLKNQQNQKANRHQNQVNFHIFLENPSNISTNARQDQFNQLLWASILERCDNISQIMLNRLPIKQDLSIQLDPCSQPIKVQRIQQDIQDLFFHIQPITVQKFTLFNQVLQFSQDQAQTIVRSIGKSIHQSLNKQKKLEYLHFQNEDFFCFENFNNFQENSEAQYNMPDLFIKPQPNINQQNHKISEVKNVTFLCEVDYQESQNNDDNNCPSVLNNYFTNPYLIESDYKKIGKKKNQYKKLTKKQINCKVQFDRTKQDITHVLFPNFGKQFQDNILPIDFSIGFSFIQHLLGNLKPKTKEKFRNKNKYCQVIEEDVTDFTQITSFVHISHTQSFFPPNKIKTSIRSIKQHLNKVTNDIQNQSLQSIIQQCPFYDPLDIFTALLHLAHQRQFYMVEDTQKHFVLTKENKKTFN